MADHSPLQQRMIHCTLLICKSVTCCYLQVYWNQRQSAVLYGMETVPVTSSHVKKLEVREIKMCRRACGHTLRDQVRNENINDRLKVEIIGERCRNARLRWFGHVKRRDQDYAGRKTLEMVPPGRRKRARPNQRWMDCVNRDMRAIGTTKYEVHDKTGWRRIVSAAATPQPGGRGWKNKNKTRSWFLDIGAPSLQPGLLQPENQPLTTLRLFTLQSRTTPIASYWSSRS